MKKLPKCKDMPGYFWYPKDSVEMELRVYRCTFREDRVGSYDFLSKYELDKRNGKDTTRFAEDDRYYGLSVYEEYSDALRCIKKVKAKNLKGVAVGFTLDGLIRKTPSLRYNNDSHVTWWPYETATSLETKFKIERGDHNE